MANKEKRVNLKIDDAYVLDLMAQGGVQATLTPLVKAGGLLHKAGVLDQLLFIEQQGLADDVGSLEALRLAIDFAEKIEQAKSKKGAVSAPDTTQKTTSPAAKSDPENPSAVTAARKKAF